MYNKLCEIISEQQKEVKDSPAFYVGEQLKDIAKGNDFITDLLINDLTKDGMSIVDAENQIKKYARGKKKAGNHCICVTPAEADTILREFYGLPNKSERATEIIDNDYIDINAYLLGDNYA